MRIIRFFFAFGFASIAILTSAARYASELALRIVEFVAHPAGAARFHMRDETILLVERGEGLPQSLINSLRYEAGDKRRVAARGI